MMLKNGGLSSLVSHHGCPFIRGIPLYFLSRGSNFDGPSCFVLRWFHLCLCCVHLIRSDGWITSLYLMPRESPRSYQGKTQVTSHQRQILMGEMQFIIWQIKVWHVSLHKRNWRKHKGRNQRCRISGHRQSMQSYILTCWLEREKREPVIALCSAEGTLISAFLGDVRIKE